MTGRTNRCARARQHHHERPHRDPLRRGRVQPHAQPAVIDLRLTAWIHRPARHGHPLPSRLLGEMCCDPPPHRRLRRRHLVLVAQPLRDRSHRHIGVQPVLDPIVVRRDQRPRRGPRRRIDPVPGTTRPINSAHCSALSASPPGSDTLGDRRRQILADRLPIDAQRLRQSAPGSGPRASAVNISTKSSTQDISPRHQRPFHPSADRCRANLAARPTPGRHTAQGGELRDSRGGELRDGQPLKPGEIRDR